ncbi:hypothetical protein [Chitiniphilus shinanonensis]|uniref:hypothetical protein n=1 Tax=Chitiniphilus shinanonensis TaxID=553088 RepID=UPI00036B5B2F|nr:hypothetical protein [Chitiniphilus shinanonensis]
MKLTTLLIPLAMVGVLVHCGSGPSSALAPAAPAIRPIGQATGPATPFPTPPSGWLLHGGQGSALFGAVAGDFIGRGSDACPAAPVALDIRPADGVLLGMTADHTLLAIAPAQGRCEPQPLGPVGEALDQLGLPVRGFAVNDDGLFAVLLDDGEQGRLVTFKPGDRALRSDLTLWAQTPGQIERHAVAFGIDFKTGDSRQLVVLSRRDARETAHVVTYRADGSFAYSAPTSVLKHGGGLHDGDIAIVGNALYLRTGHHGEVPGTIEEYALDDFTLRDYRGGTGSLPLAARHDTGPALAVRFP